MYYCLECGCEFENPVKHTEKHGMTNPPYENIYVCPRCKTTNYTKAYTSHCRCCGAKLRSSENDYCSDECRLRGERLRKKELKRKKLIEDSPLYRFVREVESYNKQKGTKYSYGKYAALIKTAEKGKNNAK